MRLKTGGDNAAQVEKSVTGDEHTCVVTRNIEAVLFVAVIADDFRHEVVLACGIGDVRRYCGDIGRIEGVRPIGSIGSFGSICRVHGCWRCNNEAQECG